MSQENMDIARAAYRKLSASGSLGGTVEFLAPDVEFHLSGAFPDLDPVYRGHDGVQKLADQLNEPWEQFALEPDRFIDLGEQVLVLSHFHGKGRDGIDVRLPFAHLWTVRDGLVVRMDAFSGHKQALDAVGLSEQDARAQGS
jgi:ketosteroid isomerase-like protein